MTKLFLTACIILLGVSLPAADGTFTVTEKWNVTVTYSGTAGTGVFRSSGTEKGTVHIKNGNYTLINHTGGSLAGMDDQGSVFESKSGYKVSAEEVFYAVGQKGRGLYAVVRLGCFTVLAKLRGTGEVPTIGWKNEIYAASGPTLSALRGSAFFINATETIRLDASSTISLQPSGGPDGITINVDVDGQGTVSPNLDGVPLKAGKTYTVTAKPKPGYIFSGWSGAISTNTPKLAFVPQDGMDLQAHFVPNPFIPVKGTYSGLVSEAGEVFQRSAGFFTVSVTEKGAWSGSLMLAGTRYSMTGQFDTSGQAAALAKSGKANPLTVNLQLDMASSTDRMTGTVRSDTWTAQIDGDRAVFGGKTNGSPVAGKYTLAIPGTTGAPTHPAGDSYGTVTVTKTGKVKFAGSLADGTKVTQSASVSKNGEWPLYVPLNNGKGALVSWITFAGTATTDLTGGGAWIKPAAAESKYYPAGFATEIAVLGSQFNPPPKGSNALGLSEAQAVVRDGGMSGPIIHDLMLDANGKATNVDPKQFSHTLNGKSGSFTGKAAIPAPGKAVSFNGVVLQKQKVGRGYFLGTSQSGRVWIGPDR